MANYHCSGGHCTWCRFLGPKAPDLDPWLPLDETDCLSHVQDVVLVGSLVPSFVGGGLIVVAQHIILWAWLSKAMEVIGFGLGIIGLTGLALVIVLAFVLDYRKRKKEIWERPEK